MGGHHVHFPYPDGALVRAIALGVFAAAENSILVVGNSVDVGRAFAEIALAGRHLRIGMGRSPPGDLSSTPRIAGPRVLGARRSPARHGAAHVALSCHQCSHWSWSVVVVVFGAEVDEYWIGLCLWLVVEDRAAGPMPHCLALHLSGGDAVITLTATGNRPLLPRATTTTAGDATEEFGFGTGGGVGWRSDDEIASTSPWPGWGRLACWWG